MDLSLSKSLVQSARLYSFACRIVLESFDYDQICQKECLVNLLKFVKHLSSFTDTQYMHFVHFFHFVCRGCSRISSVEFKVMLLNFCALSDEWCLLII